jgi:predicted RNA-binding Zn-ribbon protein involved in translation (DUF1610 family)
MENKKAVETRGTATTAKPKRTFDEAYGFSFGIALGLILFIAGLVISLTLGEGSLIFGIPLLIAGLLVPLFTVRDIFTRHESSAPCPSCGTMIKVSDATLKLECPACKKMLVVRDMQLFTTE